MSEKAIEEMRATEFLAFLQERMESLGDRAVESEGAIRKSLRRGEFEEVQTELTNARIFLAQGELLRDIIDQVRRWMDAKGIV